MGRDEETDRGGPGRRDANDRPPVDPREEAAQITRYLDVIRYQMDSLARQADLTENLLEDNSRARHTLDSVSGLREGSGALIPVGAGTFVRGTTGNPDRVMVSLGKGLVAELGREDGVKILERRFESISSQQDQIFRAIEGLRQQAAGLQGRLEELRDASTVPNVSPL